MQEKNEGTKPVRIRQDLLDKVEALAIRESAKRGRIITIPVMIAEIIEKELLLQDEGPEKLAE